MKIRKIIRPTFLHLIISILLLMHTGLAQESVLYSRENTLDIRMDASFSLEKSVDYVSAKINYFPIDSFSQDIISFETEPAAKKNMDNYEFYWKNPESGRYDLIIDSTVKTRNSYLPIKTKTAFPLNGAETEYLKATDKIDINDDIRHQASLIADGEDDLFIVAAKLAHWTKDNINYTLDTVTADASQKASWVLKNRYGVCDEITNLFIAMCRSLGIPARFVSGISYTNSDLFENPWGLHGWAEVYFPDYGWVSFDPTYGQYGYIDAGHIKLKDSIDSDKTSTKFEWQGDSKLETMPLDITVQADVGEKAPDTISIDASPYKNEVGYGSYNLIEVRLKNLKNHYVAFDLDLNAPKEIEHQGRGFIVMHPNEQKSFYFLIKVSDRLSDSYIYTFPIGISSSLGTKDETSFRSSKNAAKMSKSQATVIYDSLSEREEKTYSKKVSMNCQAGSYAYINQSVEISCTIKNEGNSPLNALKVCVDDCRKIDLNIAQTKNLNFSKVFFSAGIHEIPITAKNIDVSILDEVDVTIEDYPKLDLKYPGQKLEYDDFTISFDVIKTSYSNPKNVSVYFNFNGYEEIWNYETMDSSQKFSIDFDKSALNIKDNELNILITYHDREGRELMEKYTETSKSPDFSFLEKIGVYVNMANRALDKKIKILLGDRD